MTILVGILATDGAVIAADRALTFGAGDRLHTIADRAQKLRVLGSRTIVAGTGQVGMSQRFAHTMESFSRQLNDGVPGTTPQRAPTRPRIAAIELLQSGQHTDGVRVAVTASMLMGEEFGATKANHGQFGALMAYAAGDKPHLCEFATADFQPELKTADCWYVAMGSGQILADPYLAFMRRTFWKSGQPNVEDAVFCSMWVIYHAIEAAPGFIAHPIDIAVLKKWDGAKYTARMLTEEERDEQLAAVAAADAHLVDFRSTPAEVPPAPEPTGK